MTREEFIKQLPGLAKGYQPSPAVLKKIKNITLCIVVGPTGAGKSTIIESSGFTFVPSDTTRHQRPGEHQGVDMNFLTDYEQVVADIRNGSFVQIAVGATGDLYATRSESYPDNGVAIMPVYAHVVPIFRQLGFKDTITVFITPDSYDNWMHRIKKPGLSDEEIQKRLPESKSSFEFALQDGRTHFILNDKVDIATKQLVGLVNGQIDGAREYAAKKAVQAILQELEHNK